VGIFSSIALEGKGCECRSFSFIKTSLKNGRVEQMDKFTTVVTKLYYEN
jgi:hypothetical protein